jgi:hypothetical protein
MGTLTSAAAVDLLTANPGAYATKEALLDLLDQLDVYAEGALTAFYSGPVQGVSSDRVVEALLKQGADIRALDKTTKPRLLNSSMTVLSWKRWAGFSG